MLNKIYSFFKFLNEKGVPLPLLRDNHTNQGSVTLTMYWISFNVVLVGLVGKWSNILGGIDLTQALIFFGTVSTLHFSNQFIKKNKEIN